MNDPAAQLEADFDNFYAEQNQKARMLQMVQLIQVTLDRTRPVDFRLVCEHEPMEGRQFPTGASIHITREDGVVRLFTTPGVTFKLDEASIRELIAVLQALLPTFVFERQ